MYRIPFVTPTNTSGSDSTAPQSHTHLRNPRRTRYFSPEIPGNKRPVTKQKFIGRALPVLDVPTAAEVQSFEFMESKRGVRGW